MSKDAIKTLGTILETGAANGAASTSNLIRFYVIGIPRPGGSKRAFPYRGGDGKLHVRVSDMGGDKTKNWRNLVAAEAAIAISGNGSDWSPWVTFQENLYEGRC